MISDDFYYIVQRTKEALEEFADTMEKYRIRSDQNILSQLFLSRTVTTFYAVCELCEKGYGQDSMILVRTMLENLINYSYVNKDPDKNVKLFIEYDMIKAKKRLQVYKTLYPDKEVPTETVKIIEQRYKEIKDNYPRHSCSMTWSGKNVADMARECRLQDYYDMVYPLASSFAHGGVDTTSDYIERSTDGFKIRFGEPRPEFLVQSLSTACSLVIMTIGATCDLYEIDPPSACMEIIRMLDEAAIKYKDKGY
jgi:hypothetical protein